jgi:hypothetical protein
MLYCIYIYILCCGAVYCICMNMVKLTTLLIFSYIKGCIGLNLREVVYTHTTEKVAESH